MIRFDSVTKSYPGQSRPALDEVDLEILRGEFVFLVGASGSGKSSFLRLILKEEKPTRGTIHVLGQDLGSISTRKVPYFRRSLGVVFQDFRLLPNKNVFENVAFTLRVIGKSRGFIHQAVPETLKLVGLDGKGKRMPHELSGGEQQRVAIARAIVNKPQILLADEPTGNLDPVTSAGIMTLLERINAGGTTVVMATHEAGIVDQMQRRVIELSSGEVVRDERAAGYDGETVREFEPADLDTVTAAAPKVTPEVMRDAEPLYVEPEATDDVTDEAAEITAAATGVIAVDRAALAGEGGEADAAGHADGEASGDGAVSGSGEASDREAAAQAAPPRTLAERLGLRAPAGPRADDDDQEVGPTS
ncbi:cell division ATP-binding protein FtsE [Agromyces intestinalis]|uniref:cell division ATP-binding protein FtsE n=1 Tax=Agromyces intestinalis TaxID=2592652 RepID=UPI001FE5F22A|nr:cell division ATP-binding protein FtsE [Agromyces intestinalis]